ncbi:ketosynthase chain-length factor [Nocardia sp. CC227C]|uniref:ketosynthase chain-length factor n=1 Tax=Nocardia sp. CC227C TaxID=3044562 RepID=UPI00278BB634|nr:ketosynthase chain-length factor [Nocardia sp. CC227C]
MTGIGVVAPNSSGLERFWEAVLEGRQGIGRVSRFDVSGYPAVLAGEISDLDPAEYLPARLLPQTDVSTRLALVAGEWALADAKIDPDTLIGYEMGVVTANAAGGFEFTHREFRKLWTQGSKAVSVYESFAWFYAVNTGQLSIRHGMRGPSSALVAEQAGGLDALGHARRTVIAGTPLILAGGVDSALDPWGWSAHISGGRISRATNPDRGYLPFGIEAAGHVPGEGGAILVLEAADRAEARGAQNIYGEIAGYASTFDPPPRSARPPGLRRAAELALADAGMEPGEVDVVFADAAGVPELDRAEAEAIRGLFGREGVPVTAPKARYGRLLAGGGPLDVTTALLSLRDDLIPSAPVTSVPSEYGIDLVCGQSRAAAVGSALVLARGRWGFNAAVVVRKAPVVNKEGR